MLTAYSAEDPETNSRHDVLNQSDCLSDVLAEHCAECTGNKVDDELEGVPFSWIKSSVIPGIMKLAIDRQQEEAMSQYDFDELDSDEQLSDEEELLEATIGKDLSVHLGKDMSKVPYFARFARSSDNIQNVVQKMRLAARARGSKQRSWADTFSFTGISSKKPKFERFAKPSVAIADVVQEMRLAARAKSSKQRSWAATYSFTGKSSKKPRFERFVKPSTAIGDAVDALRLASRAKALKQRSWAATFSFTGKSSKKPKFERFAKPFVAITDAVHEMRLVASAKASKQRSWAGNFSFTGKSTKKPKFERFAKTSVAIHIAVHEMRCAAAAKRASIQKEKVRLAAENEQLIQEEQSRLDSANLEVENLIKEELINISKPSKQDLPTRWVAGSPAAAARLMRRAPATFHMDAFEQPGDPVRESSLTRGYAALGVEWHSLDGNDIKSNARPVQGCLTDSKVANRASGSALALDLGLDLTTGTVHAQKSARSSSRSGSLKSKEASSVTNNCSAMALDLGLDLATCIPHVQKKSARSQKSARSSSTGAVKVQSLKDGAKVSKSRNSTTPLRPLMVSKSAGMLPIFSNGNDPYAWSAGPLGTMVKVGRT